jgi:hypothetical protein
MNEQNPLPQVLEDILAEEPKASAQTAANKPVSALPVEAEVKEASTSTAPVTPTPEPEREPEPVVSPSFEQIQGDIDVLLDHTPLVLLGFDADDLAAVEEIPVEDCEVDATSEVLAAFDEPLPSWP